MTRLTGHTGAEGAVVAGDTGPLDAPVLLFVHGLAAAPDYWDGVVELLPAYRSVTVDLRQVLPDEGHDLVTRMTAAVVDVGLEVGRPVTLVGHSLGGAVALMASAVLGDLVVELVLIDPAGFGVTINPVVAFTGTRAGKLLLDAPFTRTGRATVQRLIRWISRTDERQGSQLTSFLANLEDPANRRSLQQQLRSSRRYQRTFDATARDSLLSSRPIVVVWGARDEIVPVEHGRAVAAAHPNVVLTEIADAGHTPHVTAPDAVAAVIAAAVPTTDAPAPAE